MTSPSEQPPAASLTEIAPPSETALRTYMEQRRTRVDDALQRFFPTPETWGKQLHEASCWALFGGGKRMRPVLALAALEAVSGEAEPPYDAVLPAACAVEMVHTYSLVHDDLPCMDDDDNRRGRPTVHVQFGEALALLAGDALLTEAFSLCANAHAYGPGVPAERILRATQMLAAAAGRCGMVGGQSIDLGFEMPVGDEETLTLLHLRKTGELFRFSAAAGALLGGASEEAVAAMGDYGEALGLAFQISDDLLDAAEDEAIRDAADTPSFPGLLGEELARRRCQELLARCDDLLSDFGPEAEPLRLLAWYAVHRDH